MAEKKWRCHGLRVPIGATITPLLTRSGLAAPLCPLYKYGPHACKFFGDYGVRNSIKIGFHAVILTQYGA